MIERTADMTLATTISLAVLRGPVPLAKTLAALDVLSEGRLIAALGPGSSKRDYDALGVPFDERWKRFDEAIPMLRALLEGEGLSGAVGPGSSRRARHTSVDRQLGLERRTTSGRARR